MRSPALLNVLIVVSTIIYAQQTPSQIAAEIPACVDACDSAAIAAVGCGATDYACHCAHGAEIKPLVLPCLQNSSSCTPAELQTFGSLIPQICAALNTTAVAPSGTSTPTSPTTTLPFTGGTSKLRVGMIGIVGLVAMVCLI